MRAIVYIVFTLSYYQDTSSSEISPGGQNAQKCQKYHNVTPIFRGIKRYGQRLEKTDIWINKCDSF